MIEAKAMLADGASIQEVLKTMPARERPEQDEVWSQGLTRMLSAIGRVRNRGSATITEHVVNGQLTGLFDDELDIAEAWLREQLDRSKGREAGERIRQAKILDLIVKVGEARGYGAATLAGYPPAAALAAVAAEVEAEAVG